jgi:hypothetical protein
VRAQRGLVLEAAYAAHPERFVRKPPTPPALPIVAWINQPEEDPPRQYLFEEVVSESLTRTAHQGKELLLIKPLTLPMLFTVLGLYDVSVQFDKRRLTRQVQGLVFL